MKLDQVKVGEKYTYYPRTECEGENRHFPVVVEHVEKRVRVRIFMEGAPGGVIRGVSAKSLVANQLDLL